MTALERLASRLGREWPEIFAAMARTEALLRRTANLHGCSAEGTSIVAFGSIARGELTAGSDMDWSLLLDGPSDPRHSRLAYEIRGLLEEAGIPQPGGTGTFGALVSSHELVHHIGGIQDTNQNLTRRILLILESRPLTNAEVHLRVLSGIFDRYVVHERVVPTRRRIPAIPHFLLNDIVRYWRTMAVDYAAKRWEQPEGKWALRNAKLRMSRKLLFAAGLLLAFRLELEDESVRESVAADPEMFPRRFAQYLLDQAAPTPLELLAQICEMTANDETIAMIFDSYDRFLGVLNDPVKRDRLEHLNFDDSRDDACWREVRELSHTFRDGLFRLFYDDDATLAGLVRSYALF